MSTQARTVDVPGIVSCQRLPLLMSRTLGASDIPTFELPPGFRLRTFCNGDADADAWVQTVTAAGEFDGDRVAARARFDSEFYSRHEKDLHQRCFFLQHDAAANYSAVVATAMAWYGDLKTPLCKDKSNVAEKEETVVGAVTGSTESTRTKGSAAATPLGRIHWVSVRPEYQGRGLSKPLVAACLQRLVKLGHRDVYLSTQTTSTRAVLLYQTVFSFRRVYQHYGGKSSPPCDCGDDQCDLAHRDLGIIDHTQGWKLIDKILG